MYSYILSVFKWLAYGLCVLLWTVNY